MIDVNYFEINKNLNFDKRCSNKNEVLSALNMKSRK